MFFVVVFFECEVCLENFFENVFDCSGGEGIGVDFFEFFELLFFVGGVVVVGVVFGVFGVVDLCYYFILV